MFIWRAVQGGIEKLICEKIHVTIGGGGAALHVLRECVRYTA